MVGQFEGSLPRQQPAAGSATLRSIQLLTWSEIATLSHVDDAPEMFCITFYFFCIALFLISLS